MYEAPSAATEAALHHPTEGWVVLETDVLEHADRHEGIVLSADVAVVILDVLDLPCESLACRPLPRPHDLLMRDVEGAHPHAVAARHVHGEHAPAAPGLDYAFAGPQAQLATNVVHLRQLRLIERGLRHRVVRTGIGHGGTEPQLVERVADVVFVMDVVSRPRERVGMSPVQNTGYALGKRAAPAGATPARAVHGFQEPRQVPFDGERAVAVGITEAQRDIANDPEQRRAAIESHPRNRGSHAN